MSDVRATNAHDAELREEGAFFEDVEADRAEDAVVVLEDAVGAVAVVAGEVANVVDDEEGVLGGAAAVAGGGGGL